MTRVGRWRRGRRRPLVGLLLAALVVVGIGAAVATPPRSAAFDDLDGRTWIAVAKPTGAQLLLVNGISGLIEGEAPVDGGDGALSFVGSGRGLTLLHGADGLVVVDDADQAARTLPGAPATAAVVGDRVLVLDDDRVSLRHPDEADDVPVAGAPAPAEGAVPVVDAAGRAWYLSAAPNGATAAFVDPAGEVGQAGVEPGATDLVVVDGVAHAVSPAGVRPIGGTGTVDAPAAGSVAPAVAEATGGVWAVAEGSTVRAGGTEPQDLGGPVEALAIWHGQVVALTPTGAFLGPPGALAPMAEVGEGPTLRLDGGLLWITTAETAVAVDARHDLTVLRVADADLSLCAGDCSAAAASRFLEENVTTTTTPPERSAGPAVTTTTSSPRRLDAEVVPPTLANVTTSSVPRPVETATPTTTAPSATTTAPPSEPDLVATTVATTPSTTEAPGNGNGNGKGNGSESDDRPPRRPDPLPLPLPLPTTAPETTTTEGPPPEPEPEPEPEPDPEPVDVGLEFEVVGGTVSAEATVRVLGSARDCGVGDERRTRATFSWQGSGTGSRDADVTWSGGANRSETARATLAPIPAGRITVRVTVCGVTAQRDTEVRPIVTTTTTTTTTPPTTTTPATTTPPTTTLPTVPTTPTTRPPTTTVPTTTPPSTTTTTTRPTTTTSGPPRP